METIPARKFRANLKDFIARIGKGEVFCVNGVLMWKTASGSQPTDTIKSDSQPPMGVSQWLAHGEKYGYTDYFKKKEAGELDCQSKPNPELVDIAKPDVNETICELCKEPKECLEKPEDGEIHLVCADCVKSRNGANWMLVWKKLKPCGTIGH